MKIELLRRILVPTLLVMLISISSDASATVVAPSNAGNDLLHAIGWQTFENRTSGNNNSGIADTTPDSNSTFDATPVGSHAAVSGGGQYLTGRIGPGASNLGHDGFGQNAGSGFLNGPTFGSGSVGSAPFGLNIVDVPLADGSAGARIGPQGQAGTSAWKFRTNGNDEFGDFSITNNSDFFFRVERIHFDARVGNANSPSDLDLIYLASGNSNLLRVDNGNELNDLTILSDITFNSAPSVQNISQSLPGALNVPTALRLAPGDSASFRFRWTSSGTAFAESQIDNLAIAGTFQDQNNGFALINPATVPEPTSIAGLTVITLIVTQRRRRNG
ncbi:MAG: PEP-CTERM sorting domain-containing protein [Planctomycetota bacterium]